LLVAAELLENEHGFECSVESVPSSEVEEEEEEDSSDLENIFVGCSFSARQLLYSGGVRVGGATLLGT
jgi:hypothetical protein